MNSNNSKTATNSQVWSELIFIFYRLSTTKCQETTISKTSEATRTWRVLSLPRRTQMTRMALLPRRMAPARTPAPPAQASRSPDTRARASTPREDQETSTTHQARSSDTWPSSPTTTISTETKANSTPWSKSSRLRCASISSSLASAHSNNSASSPTDQQSWDSQMT